MQQFIIQQNNTKIIQQNTVIIFNIWYFLGPEMYDFFKCVFDNVWDLMEQHSL